MLVHGLASAPNRPPPRSRYWNLPVEIKLVRVDKGEQRSREYRGRVNALGKVGGGGGRGAQPAGARSRGPCLHAPEPASTPPLPPSSRADAQHRRCPAWWTTSCGCRRAPPSCSTCAPSMTSRPPGARPPTGPTWQPGKARTASQRPLPAQGGRHAQAAARSSLACRSRGLLPPRPLPPGGRRGDVLPRGWQAGAPLLPRVEQPGAAGVAGRRSGRWTLQSLLYADAASSGRACLPPPPPPRRAAQGALRRGHALAAHHRPRGGHAPGVERGAGQAPGRAGQRGGGRAWPAGGLGAPQLRARSSGAGPGCLHGTRPCPGSSRRSDAAAVHTPGTGVALCVRRAGRGHSARAHPPPAAAAAAAAAAQVLQQALKDLAAYWLQGGGQAFMTGPTPCLADVQCVCELEQLRWGAGAAATVGCCGGRRVCDGAGPGTPLGLSALHLTAGPSPPGCLSAAGCLPWTQRLPSSATWCPRRCRRTWLAWRPPPARRLTGRTRSSGWPCREPARPRRGCNGGPVRLSCCGVRRAVWSHGHGQSNHAAGPLC